MPQSTKEYDIVVLGAYSYTASIIAKYVTQTLPTDLKWAVAGRSAKKLAQLVEKLKGLNSNCLPPGVEIVELERKQLHRLGGRTRLIINGIGPYHLYSSPVVEACTSMGTHYIGFSVETSWVEEMIRTYDSIARKTGAIIIPTCALTPSDLVAFLVATAISEQPSNTGTGEVDSTAKLEL